MESLQALGTDLEVKGVKPSPVPGLHEVELEGGSYLYATADARYLIAGDLYQVRGGEIVAITEERRGEKRRELLAGIGNEDMVVFTPKSAVKASVLVFTDTDCGYCRKLHMQMADYHDYGIEVRYLAYPRAGVASPTFDAMVSVWCANDRQRAMTTLKRGEGLPAKTCANPVAQQYRIGRQVGITGTPTIVLPDGRMVPGYVPPEQLADLLGI